MIHNTQSVNAVIAKIYRDLKPNIPNWEVDAIEWIGEALSFIGCGPQVDSRSATLEISSHSASLPSDLVYLKDIYILDGATSIDDIEEYEKIPLMKDGNAAISQIQKDEAIVCKNSYAINAGVIHTDLESGVFLIVYSGIALDSSGYPLVPDNAAFSEAFLWYILFKLMLRGWNHPNATITINFAQEEWRRYAAQARSRAKYPDIPDMDTFRRSWSNIIRNQNPRSQGSDGATYGKPYYPAGQVGDGSGNTWYISEF